MKSNDFQQILKCLLRSVGILFLITLESYSQHRGWTQRHLKDTREISVPLTSLLLCV